MKIHPLLFLFVLLINASLIWGNPSENSNVDDVKNNIKDMDQKMDDVRKRFADLELRMSRLLANDLPLEEVEKTSVNTPEEQPSPSNPEPDISTTDEEDSSPQPEIEETKTTKPNSLRTYYGALFPMETDFMNYQVDYEWGHHLEARISNHWETFFIAGSVGTKIFRTDKFTMPYSPGNLIMPAQGLNYSVFSSLTVGFEHYLSEKTFITSSVGIGAGWAWDKIKVGDVTMWEENDPFLYGMFQAGLGYRLFNSLSALIYYQFDGYGKRNHFDTQYFNQVGVSLGLHF